MCCLSCLQSHFINWCHHASFLYSGCRHQRVIAFLILHIVKRMLNWLELTETPKSCTLINLVWWFLNVSTTCSTFLPVAVLSVIFLSCKLSAPQCVSASFGQNARSEPTYPHIYRSSVASYISVLRKQ